MALSFELHVGPSRALRRALAAAHLSGVGGAVVLGLGLSQADRPWTGFAVAAAGLLAAALSWRRGVRGLSAGRLLVGVDGAARWTALPGAPGGGPRRGAVEPVPFEPLRWHCIGPIAWIEGISGDRPIRLLSGRDLACDAQWRQLRAWLRWMDRGGSSVAHLESAASDPISP